MWFYMVFYSGFSCFSGDCLVILLEGPSKGIIFSRLLFGKSKLCYGSDNI